MDECRKEYGLGANYLKFGVVIYSKIVIKLFFSSKKKNGFLSWRELSK